MSSPTSLLIATLLGLCLQHATSSSTVASVTFTEQGLQKTYEIFSDVGEKYGQYIVSKQMTDLQDQLYKAISDPNLTKDIIPQLKLATTTFGEVTDTFKTIKITQSGMTVVFEKDGRDSYKLATASPQNENEGDKIGTKIVTSEDIHIEITNKEGKTVSLENISSVELYSQAQNVWITIRPKSE